MYYRVAVQSDPSANFQWKSTVLSELSALLQFLRLYRAIPPDRMRVFSSSSREELHERLVWENQGRASASVTAAQLLHERMRCPPAAMSSTSAPEGGTERKRGTVAVISQQIAHECGGRGSALERRGMRALEKRRAELESRPGGDHDLPYRFVLPSSTPQVLARVKLLARVQQADLQP